MVHQLKVLQARKRNMIMKRLIKIWKAKPLSAAAAANPAIGRSANAKPCSMLLHF